MSMKNVVAAKSDQINADDLVSGSITVTIKDAIITSDDKLELILVNAKMLRACKTVSRLLTLAWGEDEKKYIGKRLTLYREPSVVYAGEKVGGIRVSHMSDISDAKMVAMLSETRGKKTRYVITRLDSQGQSQQQPAKPTTTDSSVTDEQIAQLRSRLATHIQSDTDRKRYVLETIGVKGNPTLGSSWTRDQYATATIFCDEMEGPV